MVLPSMKSKRSARVGGALGGFVMTLGVVGVYLALQLWLLPAAGIPT